MTKIQYSRVCAEGNKRLLIIQRSDGWFTFQEEQLIAPEKATWKSLKRYSSICLDFEIAWREAVGRIEWLNREENWPALNEPEKTASLYAIDFICCPFCSRRFSIRDQARWGGSRHLTCGQRIQIQT